VKRRPAIPALAQPFSEDAFMKPTNPTSDATRSAAAESTEAVKRPAPNGTRPSRRPEAARSEPSPYADDSLLDACNATPRLHEFLTFVTAAGLDGLLQGKGPLTVFAPTDRAFNKLSKSERAALLDDQPRLARVLRHHVVSGRVKAPREQEPRSVVPQFGEALRLTSTAGDYHVDEARIVKTNLRASNGVIHAIDTLLIPSDQAP
jgi:uncharacterized surface protein with fasciclin (FAS1) repeats